MERVTEFVRIDVQSPGDDFLCIVKSREEDGWPRILLYSVNSKGEEEWCDEEWNSWEVEGSDEWMYCPW